MSGAMFSSQYQQMLLDHIAQDLGQSADTLVALQQQLLELCNYVERRYAISPVQVAQAMTTLEELSGSADHICIQLKQIGRHPSRAHISRHPLWATLCYIKEQAEDATREMLTLCFLDADQTDQYDRQRVVVYRHLSDITKANDSAVSRITNLIDQTVDTMPVHVASAV